MTTYPELHTDAISTAISFVQNEPNGIAEAFRNLATDQLQALLDEIERLRAEITQANNQIKLLVAIETAVAGY